MDIRQNFSILTLAGVLVASTSTLATTQICPIVPPEKWMSTEQVEQLALDLGYEKVNFVQPDGGCWVAYSEKDGDRYEIYFHPATGEVVRTELKQN